jgi:hypothetical protein
MPDVYESSSFTLGSNLALTIMTLHPAATATPSSIKWAPVVLNVGLPTRAICIPWGGFEFAHEVG